MSRSEGQEGRQAFQLTESVRSIGREDGLDLLLSLIYLRGMSFQSLPEQEEWDKLEGHLRTDARPDQWLDDYLSASTNGLWRPGGHRSVASDGGKALRTALDGLAPLITSRHEAHLLFEDVLEQAARGSSRASAEHETPLDVADLMARCVGAAGIAVDPACGVGNALLAAHRAGARGLRGRDINAFAAARAFMRLDLAGVEDYSIEVADGLTLGARAFDGLILHPPFGVKLSREQQAALYDLPDGPPTGGPSDTTWLQVALSHLTPQGRGAVLTPVGALFRGGYDLRVRERLLRDNCVEAVVLLPDGLLTSSKIPTCLWLLRPAAEGPTAEVLFVDAAPLAQRERGKPRLT
jgi:type I restriction-modification system DNA methylase subunit